MCHLFVSKVSYFTSIISLIYRCSKGPLMSIIRKRSAPHKTLIPNNARENQYIQVKFPLTDELLQRFTPEEPNNSQPYNAFYQAIAATFFEVCQQFELKNCQFIANDKLARIRYSQEMHQWQTNQQILFYYNPSSHELNKTFFDGNVKAKQITLLFLASGLDIRLNAALAHAKVVKVIEEFAKQLAIDTEVMRIRDHQHITYDIFARAKGNDNTKTHQLRPIPVRYKEQNFPIMHQTSEMNYAVVKIPVTNHLLNIVELDASSRDLYNPLYIFIADAFTQAAKRYNLNNGALIANGLVPIIRYSEFDESSVNGELQLLGYNPEQNPCGLLSKWNAAELVDDVQLVFVATNENKTAYGYGKFLNQVEQALKLIATELELSPAKDEITMRFHQHVAYNLA